MRTLLTGAVAAVVLVFAMAGLASAKPDSNGHGKGSLPPIDLSNAANCDFIALPPPFP
jgi:hypothetical protein